MSTNRYIKNESPERDKIFEILIVLIVVAGLIFAGINHYTRPIAKSQKSIIEFHAGIFARMISNVNAIGKTQKDGKVRVAKTIFYLNERGWPANADAKKSASIKNQTEEECQELWHSVFFNAPSSRVISNTYKKNIDYVISLNKNVICRYELARKQEGSYFFDYDVSSGAVTVVRPDTNQSYSK
ncbi:MAG: hypothetical protein K6L81_00130 [Agarilytica sp.]